MAIRAMIRRRVPKEKEKEAQAVIAELRVFAVGWPGYISGETLRNVNDPEDYMVISTWKTLKDWEAFYASKKRTELQAKIEALMGEKSDYQIYDYPEPLVHPESMYFR
ncbi:MAG: antibiotic biosynthesis monooxygenase [Syntrophales bacterium]|nr:antibiotic biosynthesis monooxygenase [Syntrophales bacterium]